LSGAWRDLSSRSETKENVQIDDFRYPEVKIVNARVTDGEVGASRHLDGRTVSKGRAIYNGEWEPVKDNREGRKE